MIQSFRHRGIKRLFINGDGRLINPGQVKRIRRLLNALDDCEQVEHMNYAGTHLHELKGQRSGYWSVWISGNWRLTFRFVEGNAYDVDLEDYH